MICIIGTAVFLRPDPVEASHFRFGHLSWQRAADHANSPTIDITVIEAWREGTGGAGDIVYTIDQTGATFTTAAAPLTGTLQDFTGERYEIFTQTVRHTFPSNGVYTVSSSTTFRLVDLDNAPATPVTLGMVLDLRASNTGTPLTTGPVILQLPVDSTNSVTIPIVDPDGDPLSVRFATAEESGFASVPTVGGNALQVSPSGELAWVTTGGRVGQRFAVQLAIEENHPGFATSGRVPLEFILELVNLTTNERPTCVGPTGRLSAQVGSPLSLSIEATDPEGGRLRVTGEQLPPGAVLSPASGTTNASPSSVKLTWVPGVNNFGRTFPVTVVFTDDHGLQAVCSFSIVVDTQIPLPAFGQITGGASGTAAGASGNPAISREARFVVFTSAATNLVANDRNGFKDVFLSDRATGETRLVSMNRLGQAANGESRDPVISADGRFVAFQSAATDLVTGDGNGAVDLFVYDAVDAKVRLASVTPTGASGAGDSFAPAFSADGSRLVFVSLAEDLVSGDTNGTADVFVRDLTAGVTHLVSVSTNGGSGRGVSTTPVISDDGRRVAFVSAAPDLVTNDLNGLNDVFLRDLQLGVTRLVSESMDGASGNRLSFGPAISPSGLAVAFVSQATDLVTALDTNLQTDVFLRDIAFGTNALVSATTAGQAGNAGSGSPVFSADGGNVLFVSIATNLFMSDGNGDQDVFLWNRQSGRTELVSVNASGTGTARGRSGVTAASISRDNRYVAFFSDAGDLVAGNADTNGVSDVFVRDRQAEVTRLLSFNPTTGRVADGASYSPFVSGDGRTVVFATDAGNLLESDFNHATDIVAVNVTNATPSSLAASVFVDAPAESPAGIGFPVTVRVVNNGAEAIGGLRVANPVSDGVRRLAASFSSGRFEAGSGEWTLEFLAPRAEATLALTLCADVEGMAEVGGEVLPPGGAVALAGRPRARSAVRVLSPPEVGFQDLAGDGGDADHPWAGELINGLTLRFGADQAPPAGVRLTAHGNAHVLRFDPDVLGALPERIGIVWSGRDTGMTVEVYDVPGRRIARQTAGPSGGTTAGARLFTIEHLPGIAVLMVQTRGVVEEYQLTVHSGVAVPRGLVFEANGAGSHHLDGGLIGPGYECASAGPGFLFPDAVPQLTDAVSVEFWMLPGVALHAGSPGTRLASMPQGGIDLWYESGFVRLRVPLAAGAPQVCSARVDMEAGRWRHLAATVGDGEVRLFLDGRVLAAASLAGELLMPSGDVLLGGGVGDPFEGCLDEYAVYSGVLTFVEVAGLARHFRKGKVRPQVRAAYRRDVVELTWPTFFEGYQVEAATRVGAAADWTRYDHYRHVHGGSYEVSLPASAGYRYFRLVRTAPVATHTSNQDPPR